MVRSLRARVASGVFRSSGCTFEVSCTTCVLCRESIQSTSQSQDTRLTPLRSLITRCHANMRLANGRSYRMSKAACAVGTSGYLRASCHTRELQVTSSHFLTPDHGQPTLAGPLPLWDVVLFNPAFTGCPLHLSLFFLHRPSSPHLHLTTIICHLPIPVPVCYRS